MGCFVVAGFVLTSALCGPSAIAELLVELCDRADRQTDMFITVLRMLPGGEVKIIGKTKLGLFNERASN